MPLPSLSGTFRPGAKLRPSRPRGRPTNSAAVLSSCGRAPLQPSLAPVTTPSLTLSTPLQASSQNPSNLKSKPGVSASTQASRRGGLVRALKGCRKVALTPGSSLPCPKTPSSSFSRVAFGAHVEDALASRARGLKAPRPFTKRAAREARLDATLQKISGALTNKVEAVTTFISGRVTKAVQPKPRSTKTWSFWGFSAPIFASLANAVNVSMAKPAPEPAASQGGQETTLSSVCGSRDHRGPTGPTGGHDNNNNDDDEGTPKTQTRLN